eukprot:327660-Pyramimonas_sp.AAC.1
MLVANAVCAATWSSSRGESAGACMCVRLAGRRRTTWKSGSSPAFKKGLVPRSGYPGGGPFHVH